MLDYSYPLKHEHRYCSLHGNKEKMAGSRYDNVLVADISG